MVKPPKGRKCYFQRAWLNHSDFKEWIKEERNDDLRAYCKLCEKSFDISNMGTSALRSHMKSMKHSKLAQFTYPKLSELFTKSVESSAGAEGMGSVGKDVVLASSSNSGSSKDVADDVPDLSNTVHKPASGVSVISKSVTEAEILWALKVVMSHFSFRSCDNLSQLFKKMFPDSQIAAEFTLSRTKCTYFVVHGLAPYFREILVDDISKSKYYSVSFDESLNNQFQTEQMDIIIRYWDDSSETVRTRYLDSGFLGHTTAEDLLQVFKDLTSQLAPKSMLQVSMDGPATNWKFLKLLEEDRIIQNPDYPALLNLGSCGLHVVHGSLKNGHNATDWELDVLLRSLWSLFHDSPARRQDFANVTGCTAFPLKFCTHRWVEDANVVERAIEIWGSVQLYVTNHVETTPKCKQNQSSSFKAVRKCVEEPLTLPRLHFFLSVAKQLKPFLTKYQSDKVLVPYLAGDMEDLLRSLYNRFVMNDVMTSASSLTKLLKVPVESAAIQKKADMGFGAKQCIQSLKDSENLSNERVRQFQQDCRAFLVAVCSKIMSRCPLKYPTVRALSSVSPYAILAHADGNVSMFDDLLKILLDAGWVSSTQGDELKRQYDRFARDVKLNCAEEFQSVNESLDVFYAKFIGTGHMGTFTADYSLLWKLFQQLFVLSHGQAAIERGFCVNEDCVSVNMNEDTLKALRLVYDSVKSQYSCVEEVPIDPKLLVSIRKSRVRYSLSLESKKVESSKKDKEAKRKCLKEELTSERKKKAKLETTRESLCQEADSLCQKAEKKHDFSLLSKANALRSKSVDLMNSIKSHDSKIETLSQELKSLV